MGTIKIYIKLEGGNLYYRDSESHHGQTIETSVDPEDKIIWKLDQCSGIKELKDIEISGSANFFSKGPKRRDFDRWVARVSPQATGEVSYTVTFESCEGKVETLNVTASRRAESPKIVIRG